MKTKKQVIAYSPPFSRFCHSTPSFSFERKVKRKKVSPPEIFHTLKFILIPNQELQEEAKYFDLILRVNLLDKFMLSVCFDQIVVDLSKIPTCIWKEKSRRKACILIIPLREKSLFHTCSQISYCNMYLHKLYMPKE